MKSTLTLDIAKEMYSSWIPSLKSFALENYPELEEKRYSWYLATRGFDNWVYGVIDCSITKNPALLRTTKEMAEAVIALSILLQECNRLAKSTDNLWHYRVVSKHSTCSRMWWLSVYETADIETYPLVFFKEDIARRFLERNKELLHKAFILL